jgi:azurin
MSRRMLCCSMLMILAACGGEKPAPAPEPAAPAKPAEPEKPATPPPAPAPAPAVTIQPDADGVVHLTGDDLMHYNANRIEVAADKPFKVELKHIGKMTADVMGHNFVLLKPGNDQMQFAAKGMAAKATMYIADEVKDQVIAHTRIVGGGETDTIEVTLPGPGTYPFLCTFPGHVGLMKGELVAK